MPRGKPVVLDTRTFLKREDARNFFSAMLNKYKPGDRVSDVDTLDLSELLKRHPEALEKIGVGIAHFEVQRADYSTQCFRVVRTDGTSSNFSYQKCVAPDARK